MIIAINTRLLIKDKLEGIGWFMHENLQRITRGHPEHTFLFLFDRPFATEFIYSDNIKPVVVPPPARHPVLWHIWLEYSLPRILRKNKAELYVGPDGYMPLNLKIPSHITIHDINFHHRPEDLPGSSRSYYCKNFPRFATAADRIATVSEYSKKDIMSSYNVAQDKIDVVYNGVNEIYSPLPVNEAQRIRESITGGSPYFIFIGSLHPRKNLPNLLRAFDLFKSELDSEFKLLIIGEKMFMTGEINKAFEGMIYREDVIFTGRLSPADLRERLAASSGMTFLPLFEGFGIPLLEAMRCEVPILASNVTSLPEIAADAAIYADPFDPGDISNGMIKLARDTELTSKLIQAGKKRAGDFSWNKTAEMLWSSICRVIEQC
ncbi:glycosyltransferase family 4 protein [Bacteroidota bacterium]